MGGLVNGTTVKGDLWMIEAGGGNLACYPVGTTFEGPGPRVGHASLLVGNAFIVFGGDTKMDDRDKLDDTLYLLNTCEYFPEKMILWLTHWTSYSALVTINAPGATTGRAVRPHVEHFRLKDLCFWWAGRGLFFQRPGRIRFECLASRKQSMGTPRRELSRWRPARGAGPPGADKSHYS